MLGDSAVSEGAAETPLGGFGGFGGFDLHPICALVMTTHIRVKSKPLKPLKPPSRYALASERCKRH